MKIKAINSNSRLKIKRNKVIDLARCILKDEGIIPATNEISIIFVDDEFLRKLHKDYLNDDSYTDVMSFNLSEDEQIDGEIYISLDRAQHYATKFGVTFGSEVTRLIIHGILHLKGYDDATEDQKKEMHDLENAYLEKYSGLINLL